MDSLNPKTRKWNARWIWPEDRECEDNFYALFRREVTLEKGEEATIFISADTRYRLYIDGKELSEGPLRSQTFNMYYDSFPVTLDKGVHCLAAEVYHMAGGPASRGGFLMEGVDREGRTLFATRADWPTLPAPQWWGATQKFPMNRINAFQEFFDARKIPVDGKGVDWRLSGYDDSRWADAAEVSGRHGSTPPQAGPWSLLRERDIPPMELTPLLPVRVERAEECLSLANRQRPGDVSIRLSMPGQPVKFTRARDLDRLCDGSGGAVVRCSVNHLEDRTWDGFYDPALTLDFGRQRTAYLELEVEGPAGARIEYGFAERLIDGRFNNSLEGWFGGQFHLSGKGRERFKTFNWIGFRYLRLRITDAFENLTIHSLRAVNTAYPFKEGNTFSCEDDRLERIFSLCRNTLRLCSNEFLMDTPWREQGQWLGDVAAVTLGGIYSCFGNNPLIGKFLNQSAASQLPTGLLTNMTNSTDLNWQWVIPDYTLWWVWALWNHYEYTGEADWIHRYYPHVLKILQFFSAYLDETGLLYRLPAWNLIDWAPLDRRGYAAGSNGVYHAALGAMEKMADFRGDAYYGDLIRKQRRGIEAAFAPAFYDRARGVCVDCLEDGVPSEKVSEHVNALALWCGLVDDDAKKSIIDRLFLELPPGVTEAQPYFATFVLKALVKEGRTDLALKIVEDRWGGRMADRGMESCFEEWGENGSWRDGKYAGFMRTRSHAWSAYAAEFLVRDLTGFSVVEPGCGVVRLNPTDIGRDYAVEIPLPQGTVKVSMTGGEPRIDLPPGVSRG